MELEKIQTALKEASLDGWLFYDFRSRDQIAARILKMDNRFRSRRWYYFIPSEGEPQKLVHAIEPWSLDHLPGTKHIYLPWQQQHSLLSQILAGKSRVAMQYSPNNAIPYVSCIDGGTLELIRSFGVEVITSANLVSRFESFLSESDIESHKSAGEVMQLVKDEAFKEISNRIKAGLNPTEYEIQLFMQEIMRTNGMHWDDGPIVAINEHAADPHFEPTADNSYRMKEGDLVLLDLWAKKNKPGSIYYDITWMGYIGAEVPSELESIFRVVCDARDAGYKFIKNKFDSNEIVRGCDVDDVVRKVVVDAGYGSNFIHRTGHNIAEDVHGNGTHMDNLETKDERAIIKGSCFSIEPGIYLPDRKIGFRTEIDVYIDHSGNALVAGDIQEKIIPILNL